VFDQQSIDPARGEKFKDYATRMQNFWHLKPLVHAVGNIHFSCSCPQFMNYAKCKHAVGMSIHQEKWQVPDNWKINKLQRSNRSTKKRGRPEKAAPALQQQSTVGKKRSKKQL